MRTLADIANMARKEPNDQELGRKVREFLMYDDKKHHRICIKCGRWQSDLNSVCQFCGKPLNTMNYED